MAEEIIVKKVHTKSGPLGRFISHCTLWGLDESGSKRLAQLPRSQRSGEDLSHTVFATLQGHGPLRPTPPVTPHNRSTNSVLSSFHSLYSPIRDIIIRKLSTSQYKCKQIADMPSCIGIYN